MFSQKVVLITGAGAGLGLALAKEFASKGATVIGLGRSQSPEFEALGSAQEGLEYVLVDVSDSEAVGARVTEVLQRHGKVDYLFNNAAVYPRTNFVEESSVQFSEALAINVTAVATMAKLVLPSMIKQKFGRIINIGSWADRGVIENSAVYCTSKGALHALTQGIAKDIEHLGLDIGVYEWIPGALNTKMGIADGLDPNQVAPWIAALLTRADISKNEIFVGDEVYVPPQGLKERLKNKVLFWRS